jgi:poly(A) polymerase
VKVNIEFSDKEQELLKHMSEVAADLQMKVFVIGGYVRDKILNRFNKDIDIVCLGDGIFFAEKLAQKIAPKAKVAIFKTYGTAHFRYGDIDLEFVGARKESYHRDSRNPVVSPGTLEDDQNRRDFTINALALSLNKENYLALIDPFDGLEDLQLKLIRTPLAPKQTFSDDPLRMMRAIRFASQLGFYIEQQCFDGIKEEAHRIEIITKERIAVEFNKILMSPKPSKGLDLLYKSGLLVLILPQLTALAGTEYIDNKGHKDNLYHTFQVVDNIAQQTDNLWLRWAALLHDIGKAPTKKFEKGTGWTFHGHEIVSAKMVPKIFKNLKLPLHDAMEYVQKIVTLHHRPISLTKDNITDSAVRRLLFDAGNDIDDLMTMCRADITSKNPAKVEKYLKNFDLVVEKLKTVEENDKIRNWQPPISGDEIMKYYNLSPSREVGLIKTAIREAILDGEVKNNYEDAFEFMKAYVQANLPELIKE